MAAASSWCAVCGGSPERAIVDQIDGMPRCAVCSAAGYGLRDWNPRTRNRPSAQPDGNASNAARNPDGWNEWLRISESWGHP